MTDSILLRDDGAVATVTLNRPERLNALDRAAWADLTERIAELNQRDYVRCVVVRGADQRAFSAGADISAFDSERSGPQAPAYGELEFSTINALATCRHPTIAMIAGVCVGGGLELACACDLRVAARSATFGLPINRLGHTLSYDEIRFVRSVLGRVATLDLLMTGDVVGIERAQQMGLVFRVVDDDDLENETYGLAKRVAERAPLVNRWHKKFINRLDDPRPLSEAEIAEGYAAFLTSDHEAGRRAFLEKKQPRFEGR